MWQYRSASGELLHNGVHVGYGYAGHGAGKNQPAMENIHDIGPIPRGNWLILGPPSDTTGHGPYVLRLIAFPGTQTFGRGGFLIHGDSVSAPGTASLGCIVLAPDVRHAIWMSGDHGLVVE